jgi:hypothetical protein
MFNIIWIPIVYSSNTGVAPSQGWWVFGDTFDIYPNNEQYYGVNIWSGYNAVTTGNGGPFTSVVGSPNQGFISGLIDQGSIGGTWTGSASSTRIVTSGYMGFGGEIDIGSFKIGHKPAYLLNDFTAELWVKRLSNSWNPATYGRIIEKGFHNGFTINGIGGNNIQAFVNGTNVNFANQLPLNEWTHLAITRSGSNMKVYMSGYLNAQGTVSSATLTNVGPLEIGTTQAEPAQWLIVDEFRLWNYARTSGQITSNINTVVSSETGLLNYLRFNSMSWAPSGYGATTGIIYRQYELLEDNFDSYKTGNLSFETFESGLQDYGTLGSSWTGNANIDIVSTGYIGYAGFLKNGGAFQCGHNPAYLLNDFTAEIWVKRLSDSWGTAFGRIVEKSFSNGFTINRDNGSNKVNLSIMGDQDAYNNTIPLNVWTHLAVVRSGSTAFLYISGVLDKQVATSSSQLTNTNPLGVGQNPESVDQILVDEFRLWNYARTSGEIVSNMNTAIAPYQSGLLNYLRFDVSGIGRGFLLTGGYWFDKYQSGSLAFIKGTDGYIIPQTVLESDTFDNYNTGTNYTGTFTSLGYTLNKLISGSTGNFYINHHDIFVVDTFNYYQDGTITSLTSGLLISGDSQFIRTGTAI